MFPDELKALRQWCCWRYVVRDNGKPGKLPLNADGSRSSSKRRELWCSYAEASESVERWGFDGVGFMFSRQDPYIGLDFDNCLAGGKVTTEAARWALTALDGTYMERSPSGNGFHAIVRGHLPWSGRRTDSLEVYQSGRFFAVTERGNGKPVIDCQPALDAMVARWFREDEREAERSQVVGDGSDTPVVTQPRLSPSRIIALCCNSRDGYKWGCMHFTGQWEQFYASRSQADMAYISLVTFFVGPHLPTIRQVALLSQLKRPKWFRRIDGVSYLDDTISTAIRSKTHWYSATFTKETA